MNRKRLREKPWYPNAVALCIAVVLYVLLTHLGVVWGNIRAFLGFFAPVFWGCLIAYLVRPLAKKYRDRIFRRVKRERLRTGLANGFAFGTVILIVGLLLLLILPQLVQSIGVFAGNLDGYIDSFQRLIGRWDFLEHFGFTSERLESAMDGVIASVTGYVKENLAEILNRTADMGRGLFQFFIGFIISLYLLGERHRLKLGVQRLMKVTLRESSVQEAQRFLERCDVILGRYIVFNVIDSLIVGVLNAIFMAILGLPYVGLVSVAVAVSNLVPTLGPFVGAIIGGFVLVLVQPWYALAFLAFTLVLQIVDGYILKPRLFGSSLGVSGLWVLVGVVVGGRMFGITGILAAIPAVAILDFTWRDWLLPRLEARRQQMKPEE